MQAARSSSIKCVQTLLQWGPVFVLKNLVRSSLEHEIFHLAASRFCELDHFSQLTEVLDHM